MKGLRGGAEAQRRRGAEAQRGRGAEGQEREEREEREMWKHEEDMRHRWHASYAVYAPLCFSF